MRCLVIQARQNICSLWHMTGSLMALVQIQQCRSDQRDIEIVHLRNQCRTLMTPFSVHIKSILIKIIRMYIL